MNNEKVERPTGHFYILYVHNDPREYGPRAAKHGKWGLYKSKATDLEILQQKALIRLARVRQTSIFILFII